jgi:uncharacterized damage-inducible protein DinB
MRLKTLFLLTAVASSASAQGAVSAAKAQWRSMHDYIRQSAVDVPESKYAWKPTPEVRSVAEQFMHVANNESAYCAMALGQTRSADEKVTATTKATLIAALDKAAQDCDKAYSQTDAAATAKTTVYGQQQSRLFALILNATHDAEHYGNLVTYLRLNKIVPPSSR